MGVRGEEEQVAERVAQLPPAHSEHSPSMAIAIKKISRTIDTDDERKAKPTRGRTDRRHQFEDNSEWTGLCARGAAERGGEGRPAN